MGINFLFDGDKFKKLYKEDFVILSSFIINMASLMLV